MTSTLATQYIYLKNFKKVQLQVVPKSGGKKKKGFFFFELPCGYNLYSKLRTSGLS